MTNATFVRYERLCRLHIIPKLAKVKVQTANQVDVQNFIDYLAENLKFGRKSCLLVTTILKDVFRLAIKEKLVKINPVNDIELPKASERKMSIWDSEHFQKFLSLRSKKK